MLPIPRSAPLVWRAKEWLLSRLFFFSSLLSCEAQTLLLVVVGIYGPVYLISREPILISEAAREGLHWTAR